MPKQNAIVVAAALAALLPLLPVGAAAEETRTPLRLAMMDMMPTGGGGMQQGSAGMGMDDGMRMGGMQAQPAQGGAGMPGMGQPGAAPQPGTAHSPARSGQQGGMGMGGMRMDDDMTRMGGGVPAQGQAQMPVGQMPQQPMSQAQMPGCMPMMQNMMRMGAPQQGTGMGPMGGAMADGMPPSGSSAARLEGRIAFLRTELRVTPAQAQAWEAFANTLRSGREHLDAARAALQESTTAADPMARLESYENHLRARTEAIHLTRMAFNTLYGQLDDAQKRMATTTMLPFIGAF